MAKHRILLLTQNLCIILILFLVGCSSIGPKILHLDRYNYNQIMRDTSNQELLFNMVRLRYDEAPMTIKVGNISGSTSFQRQASIFGTFYYSSLSTSSNTGFNTQTTYIDNPIISYTPLDDKSFTQSFLSALKLSDINTLLQSSWSISRVFRVSLQSIGYAVNAPNSARATSSHAPEYKDFLAIADIFRRMQLADSLTQIYTIKGTVEELALVIKPGYYLKPKEKALFKKAGIKIHQNKIILTNTPEPNKVYVVTRSMLGILNYLSKGLEVPPIDLKNKVITQTYYPNGKVFNWQAVVNGMMEIHYSETRPQNAIVAIPYRNKWFYISDADSNSKQTLILLSNIAGLVQTSPLSSTTAPGLTRAV
jgi:hypothetical protein